MPNNKKKKYQSKTGVDGIKDLGSYISGFGVEPKPKKTLGNKSSDKGALQALKDVFDYASDFGMEESDKQKVKNIVKKQYSEGKKGLSDLLEFVKDPFVDPYQGLKNIPTGKINSQNRSDRYAYGGTAMERDTPLQSLFKHKGNTEEASFEAMYDPLVQGLDQFGQMAMSKGVNMISSGFSKHTRAGGKLDWGNIFSTGGTVPTEVEGGEMGELPNGELVDFQGPNHESGGIPTELPSGTDIYSKRLKVNGEKMVDRKRKREEKITRLERLVKADPYNKNLKKTLEMVKQDLDGIDQKDMQIQNAVHEVKKTFERAYGGTVDEEEEELEEELELLQDEEDDAYLEEQEMLAEQEEEEESIFDQIYGVDDEEDEDEEISEEDEEEEEEYGDGGTVGRKRGSKYYFNKKNTPTNLPEMEGWLNDLTKHFKYDLNLDDTKSTAGFQNLLGMKGKAADGKFGGDTYKALTSYLDKNPLVKSPYKANFTAPTLDDTQILSTYPQGYISRDKTMETGLYDPMDISQEHSDALAAEWGDYVNREEIDEGNTFNPFSNSFSVGDITGMAGSLYGALAGRSLTMKNRRGDTANINHLKDYGKDGLKALQSAKENLGVVRDDSLQDLERTRNATFRRANNSARSVNTARALNLAADASLNDSKSKIHSNYANQVTNMLQSEANLLNARDNMVMQGEAKRDLADRMDRDNFFSQLAIDNQSLAEGIQRAGGQLNKNLERKLSAQALSQLSKYFDVDLSTEGAFFSNKIKTNKKK